MDRLKVSTYLKHGDNCEKMTDFNLNLLQMNQMYLAKYRQVPLWHGLIHHDITYDIAITVTESG